MTATNTTYVVRVSCAKMPSSCWGRYVHVAVIEVVDGYKPTQIRDVKGKARVVRVWSRCHDGQTKRCASAKAIRAAEALAAELTARRQQAA